ncbi:MAG: DUF493 domain-containing protein [Chloroflexi bacterium]|nr:DUF493 domain-containing protein [Chloroflexota bacterium]MBU1750749.1 DUF493 domain-containing protein [Chloroflexota bacterium]MBU1877419.1 DUF493 domain-containing protein [Chloroflexota bacterium]
MTDDSEETLFEFPCEFPLKVIGRHCDDLEDHVCAIVRRHVPDLDRGLVSSRSSREGKYLAITLTFTAESKAQLDALYRDLGSQDGVVMVL